MPRKKLEVKDQSKEESPKVEVRPSVKLEPWTVDIREPHGDKVTEKQLDAIVDELKEQGRKLTQLYCTDTQRDKIKTFDKYKKLTLTTA